MRMVALVFFLVCTNLLAQEKWTLDDCVAYALDHNLQLNDFEYTKQSNKETYRQSIRSLLPRINASTDYVVNFGAEYRPLYQ